MKKMFPKAALRAIALGLKKGCAGEEDTVIMAPVPTVNSEFTPKQEWSTSAGDGAGHYFSKLTPELAYDKVFVASREGIVKALDPLKRVKSCGKPILKKKSSHVYPVA